MVLFLAVAFLTVQDPVPGRLADGLFRFDPLAALASMLASRAWIDGMAWSLGVVLLTLVLGRVWCGWVCPLGTTLEYVRFGRARRRASKLPARLRSLKYFLLVVVVVVAALGSLTPLVLDPLTIFGRTAAAALVPGVDVVLRGLEALLAHLGPLASVADWIDVRVRGRVLPSIAPVFAQGMLIGALFIAVIGLNMLADRFWCRYLCPLGALLGALAKFALLRPLVGGGCTDCARCAAACRLTAIEAGASPTEARSPSTEAGTPRAALISSECTVCLDCLVACKEEGAMRFGWHGGSGPWRAYDPGRRTLLTATAAGIGSMALIGAGPWQRVEAQDRLRPPGVTEEEVFLSTCIRCGTCLNVCPTNGLQPAGMQAGLEGFWTPILTPRIGSCDYACTACGQACPTAAIPPLRLGTKRRQVIGVAAIDRDRCLPWSEQKACVVCNEVCPVPGNAIELDDGRKITLEGGIEEWLVLPAVAPGRCIGCGACEYACPVQGEAAIRIWRRGAGPAPVLGRSSPPG